MLGNITNAKQKHLGYKKVRGQSEAALQIGITVRPKTLISFEAKKLLIKNCFNYLNDILPLHSSLTYIKTIILVHNISISSIQYYCPMKYHESQHTCVRMYAYCSIYRNTPLSVKPCRFL